MNNKNLYLYMQRFYSKILVKPVNSMQKNLSKKSSNSSSIFFKSKNKKFFLSSIHPKKKLFVILVLRGKWSVLFSTCLGKELNACHSFLLEKKCTKGNSYFCYLTLRLSMGFCQRLCRRHAPFAPKGHGQGPCPLPEARPFCPKGARARGLVFSKYYFFKRIKKVKTGKRSKLSLQKKSILKTFYFVFCMFLKTSSQNFSLNLLLDSLSASKYLNKTSLILLNFYRICKLYKQLKKKTQLFIDQKLYNNLKFKNLKFAKGLLIRITIKSKPFIQKIEYLQVKSFNYYNFQIVRPLLSITRLDTFYLSESLKLPIYPDFTNLEVQFLRNRIRKQILPAIRILVNPQFDTILCNFNESHLVIKNINNF